MDFRIADTFTDSLARLTGDEQKAVKTTAFDLQLNPANPGMSFHKLDKAKDKNFWSVRVNRDIRLIVHKSDREPAALLRRPPRQGVRLGGTAQAGDASRRRAPRSWSRSARRCKEIVVPVYVADGNPLRRRSRRTNCRLFAGMSDDELLGYGVPAEWLNDVGRRPRTRCWPWRTTCLPRRRRRCWSWRPAASPACRYDMPWRISGRHPFRSSRRQRRFRVMTQCGGTAARPRFPWEKWTVFLHPEQREMGGARLQPALRASPVRQARARPSWRCTGPSILARSKSRRPRPADDVLRHTGERAANQAEATAGQRTAPRRTD